MNEEQKSVNRKKIYIIAFILNIFLLPFFIILAAYVEYKLFGSSEVENLCRVIGIHGFIGNLIDLLGI